MRKVPGGAIELSDLELEAVAGGKGRRGGAPQPEQPQPSAMANRYSVQRPPRVRPPVGALPGPVAPGPTLPMPRPVPAP